MKKIVLLFIYGLIGLNLFAQRTTPALDWGGQNSVSYWNEHEVVINIGGNRYTYLMYNSRDDRTQVTAFVFDWFRRHNQGYSRIDYSNVRTLYPNEGLSENVKTTMTQRNCDISFTFIDIGDGVKQLVINFRSNDGRYYTTMYYFYMLDAQ